MGSWGVSTPATNPRPCTVGPRSPDPPLPLLPLQPGHRTPGLSASGPDRSGPGEGGQGRRQELVGSSEEGQG